MSLLPDDLLVYHDDHPNAEVSGLGLAYAPFMCDMLGRKDLLHWMMAPAEQAAIVNLLQWLRPKIGIEIGSRFGGSLQALSRFCDRVFSLDSDPSVAKRLSNEFANVEFVIGSSAFTLPGLLSRLKRTGESIQFALVDGDHSYSGVKSDIDSLLAMEPKENTFIVMHDSFIPECRRALREAKWADNKHVRYVELDFVPGTVNQSPGFRGYMCGGLSLACMTPEQREGELRITARAELTFQRIAERA